MRDYSWLIDEDGFSLSYERNLSLNRYGMGTGGVASLALFPKDIPQLIFAVDRLESFSVGYKVLGKTSNVLFGDGQIETVLIFTDNIRQTSFAKTPFAACGVSAAAFLKECKARNLLGGEFLAGIPCSIGGAAYMNAGVQGGYFEEIVQRVLVYEDGEILSLSRAECGYSYKHSRFMEKGVILGVFFRLEKSNEEEIEKRIRFFNDRRKNLPKGKSLGCIFKNPKDVSAGKLIENAGLKGLRLGGAVISNTHANFIINETHATARDVKELIQTAKNAVRAQYNVRLEEEIEYID